MKITDKIQKLISGVRTKDILQYEGTVIPRGIVSENELLDLKASLELYSGDYSLEKSGCSLELASGISSELARLTVTEFEYLFPETKDGRFFEKSFRDLFSRMRLYTEYACATGGVMFKPFFDGKKLSCECFLPFDFVPLEADGSGKIVSCAFIYTIRKDNRLYIRIEEHMKKDNGYMITNKAYYSENGASNEKQCSLSEVKEWASLSDSVFIENLSRPLFAYFGIPLGNPKSPGSPLGVPVFRRAEKLIKEADIQFGRLLWEFEGGELAVDASEDAFRMGRNGKPELPPGKERLYRSNALDSCSSAEELIKTFSPELRDKSLINGLNRIIMFVEDACGIARGTFSDPSEIARTATEVRAMRQKTYSTVCGIQKSLENTISELIDAASQLSLLYSLISSPISVKLSFGDGVLTDSESDRESEREDVKCGIITAEEFRKRWY